MNREWATTSYSAGDVLIFHCLTVHSATPNTSDRLRISVDFRCQLADPISAACLKPNFYPDVPDRPTLSDGWSTTRWIEPPAGYTPFRPTRPASLDRLHLELVVPPSRILAAAESTPAGVD